MGSSAFLLLLIDNVYCSRGYPFNFCSYRRFTGLLCWTSALFSVFLYVHICVSLWKVTLKEQQSVRVKLQYHWQYTVLISAMLVSDSPLMHLKALSFCFYYHSHSKKRLKGIHLNYGAAIQLCTYNSIRLPWGKEYCLCMITATFSCCILFRIWLPLKNIGNIRLFSVCFIFTWYKETLRKSKYRADSDRQ